MLCKHSQPLLLKRMQPLNWRGTSSGAKDIKLFASNDNHALFDIQWYPKRQAKPSAERIQHEFEIGNFVFCCLCFFLWRVRKPSAVPYTTPNLQCGNSKEPPTQPKTSIVLFKLTSRICVGADKTTGHEYWPLPVAIASGHGHWQWPVAMAAGHGHRQWPVAMACDCGQ